MSTEFGIALCALIAVIALFFNLEALKIQVNVLEKKVELLRNYNESQEIFINGLFKHVDQNVCDIRRLSESCSQIDDLNTKIKVSQKDIERTLDMIEELKAKRSMDILDKLREESKE